MKTNKQCQTVCNFAGMKPITVPALPFKSSNTLLGTTILLIRRKWVMLDTDLATFYALPTKRLNEYVRRNPGRFTDNCMFQLTKDETTKVVANCGHLKKLIFSPHLPYAYTELGIAAFAGILKNDKAIQATVEIMSAFAKTGKTSLRENAAKNRMLTDREIDILNCIKDGKRTNDISQALDIREVTVKFHVSNIMNKLKASSRFSAVIIATSNGWID